MQQDDVEKLAIDHVDWFLELIRPLLITYFLHGHKHGLEEKDAD